MELQCDICYVDFDLDLHRPKSLPCGHTICKECVQNPELGRRCPTCRKDLPVDLDDLPDTILAIRLIENGGAPPRKKPRREDSDQQRLQRGVDAGRKVVAALRLAVPKAVEALNRQLDAAVAQLRQLEEALEQVQRSAAGDEGTSQEQLLQLADGLSLLTTKCSVVTEEEDGSTWKTDVQLDALGDDFRLLLQLRTDGQLAKVDDAAVPCSHDAYIGPPKRTILSITDDDLTQDDLKVNDILRANRRWKNIRCIQGLKGKGSDQLLRVLSPQLLHLEELECSGPVGPEVLEEVLKLSSLKRLGLGCVNYCDDYPDLPLQLEELEINRPSERQLRCVQRMPTLRSLLVRNYHGSNVTFTPSQYGTLRWLGVSFNTDHKPTILSLISAHASSLQELRVYCTSSKEEISGLYYFPDLGQELSACGLLHLRRLVLGRQTTDPCTDLAGCLEQRLQQRAFLPSSVEVVCDSCSNSALVCLQ